MMVQGKKVKNIFDLSIKKSVIDEFFCFSSVVDTGSGQRMVSTTKNTTNTNKKKCRVYKNMGVVGVGGFYHPPLPIPPCERLC